MNEPARMTRVKLLQPQTRVSGSVGEFIEDGSRQESGAICMELCYMQQVTIDTWYHLMQPQHLLYWRLHQIH
jgi:hypothetical protein